MLTTVIVGVVCFVAGCIVTLLWAKRHPTTAANVTKDVTNLQGKL